MTLPETTYYDSVVKCKSNSVVVNLNDHISHIGHFVFRADMFGADIYLEWLEAGVIACLHQGVSAVSLEIQPLFITRVEMHASRNWTLTSIRFWNAHKQWWVGLAKEDIHKIIFTSDYLYWRNKIGTNYKAENSNT